MQQVTDATIQLAITLIAILLGVIALCVVVEGGNKRRKKEMKHVVYFALKVLLFVLIVAGYLTLGLFKLGDFANGMNAGFGMAIWLFWVSKWISKSWNIIKKKYEE